MPDTGLVVGGGGLGVGKGTVSVGLDGCVLLYLVSNNRSRKRRQVQRQLFNVILGGLLKVMLKRAGELVEQPDLLAVLQEAGRCRRLVSDDDALIASRTESQGHLMLVFMHRQVVFICESLSAARSSAEERFIITHIHSFSLPPAG